MRAYNLVGSMVEQGQFTQTHGYDNFKLSASKTMPTL